jgi:hypothetical protein
VSRPRKIDPVAAVRFVESYDGAHGKPFRDAAAAHFGVSGRTVERELPRLVRDGFLAEEALSGKGGPKAYRAGGRPLVTASGFRRTADSRPSVWELAARRPDVGTDDPAEVERFFRAGVLAICHRCGAAPVVQRYEPTPDCPEFRHGPMLRADGFPVELPPRPEPEPEATQAEIERNAEKLAAWLSERASDPH